MKNITVFLVFIPFIMHAQTGNNKNINAANLDSLSEAISNTIAEQAIQSNRLASIKKVAKTTLNKPDSVYSFRFSATSDSLLTEKTYFRYNDFGIKTNENIFKWNDIENEWYNPLYADFDSVGRIKQSTETTYNNEYHGVYVSWYYVNGKMIYDTTYYSYPAYYYTNTNQFSYLYDSAARLLIRKDFYLVELKWYPSGITNTFYSSDGFSKEEYFYPYGATFPYNKSIYIYDSLNNIIEYTKLQLPNFADTIEYQIKTKYEHTYDSQQRDTSFTSHYWSFNANKWIKASNTRFRFNVAGQLQEVHNYKLDSLSQQLLLTSKVEYHYDANDNLWVREGYAFNKNDNSWRVSRKLYYYYSNLSSQRSSIGQQENNRIISVFPNPSSGVLSVELQESSPIAVYNCYGQLTKTFSLKKGTNTIDLSHSKPGVYVIVIRTEQELITKKIIIE